MVTVYRKSLPKERLLAMPKEERVFFLQLGNVRNQLSLFARLLWFSVNRSSDTGEMEKSLLGAQTHQLARITIGLVNEAWEYIAAG